VNPEEFRQVGHRLIDTIANYLDTVEERPVFPDVAPEQLYELFDEAIPESGTDPQQLLQELDRKFFPYCSHVSHPGYMGLITPSPTPMGILGDLIASAMNQNIGAYTIGPSGVAMERRVVRWLCDVAGYGAAADGNLTSGGMMANFVGLKLARDWATQDQAQHDGVTEPLAAYTSEERHISVDKAADAIGIGRRGLRVLPTDDHFRLRIDALENALAEDKRAGVKPVCIIAMGGSTNTGAIDDLAQLRRIADRERAWLHVDAAYGGGMLISREFPNRLRGIEQADSITIDPHKWFFAPLDAGAILVRDARRLTKSFGLQPSYLTDEMDTRGERYQYFVHSFEQSRRLRGLKVWLSFKRYGAREIASWIDRNVRQAYYLYELVQQSSDFVPAVEPTMSAICIRYTRAGMGEPESAQLHAQVARRIEESGQFWISTTVLKERNWFRINPVNFRTREEHMAQLLTLLRHECEQLAPELSVR
jgi:glutamate/tyrosine decarboxylase-like PLP-dependent enzyme